MVSIEIYFYFGLKSHETWSDSYNDRLMRNTLIWRHSKKNEIYPWFTYSFLHANASHLAGNLVLQIVLGLLLEMEHKSVRIFIIYVAGVRVYTYYVFYNTI